METLFSFWVFLSRQNIEMIFISDKRLTERNIHSAYQFGNLEKTFI